MAGLSIDHQRDLEKLIAEWRGKSEPNWVDEAAAQAGITAIEGAFNGAL